MSHRDQNGRSPSTCALSAEGMVTHPSTESGAVDAPRQGLQRRLPLRCSAFHGEAHRWALFGKALTCSYCCMRGAIAVSVDLDDINITRGGELLSLYQFNTNTARHYFCSRCGIYTHHRRRSNPKEYGVNVACLEGISPFDFQEVPVYDGKPHTADGFPVTRAGTLIFRAAE